MKRSWRVGYIRAIAALGHDSRQAPRLDAPLGHTRSRSSGTPSCSAQWAQQKIAIRLYAVADDPALAMSACWRESVDGAFEAVEDMCCSSGPHLERLVVIVPAHLTDSH